tara:strand:+ start:278 stop:1054 length:777 start_codon:yes stop_codon:yes gene_type:complete
MNRIANYEELAERLDKWLKDYYYMYSIESFVVGVSGGIDSAVVSTLCAKTGLPTYVLTMPLNSKKENTELSDAHANALCEKYDNVTKYDIDLSEPYDKLISTIGLRTAPEGYTTNKELIANQHVNANTKSRMRMVTLYQIAGVVKGVVVGTGNKVEDYGVGFYTKYGDGGVDIAPIADLYKTEVWELGRYLGVDQRIIDADPTDGLWDDSRTDETQLGATYAELEEAMETGKGSGLEVLTKFNTQNKHKMDPIPTFKL